jgi:glyoxylase-like metal-dependent hydrolase (beta-lactamase superfamily II)
MQIATADSWYKVERLADGVTLISEQFIEPYYRCNIWHVRGRDRDLLVDSGMGVVSLRRQVALTAERPLLAVASHAHFDHIGNHVEFPERAIHKDEADILANPTQHATVADVYAPKEMFLALPPGGYEQATYRIEPAPATRLLSEGDVIDLGDRHFEVLHLPGHSPGSIGLWEGETGIFFSGDAIYDGPLSDQCYHSHIPTYLATMERLRKMKPRIVHGGHFPSFDGARYVALIDEYIEGKRKMGCPSESAAR